MNHSIFRFILNSKQWPFQSQYRQFSRAECRFLFFESSSKGGYGENKKFPAHKLIRDGFMDLKGEIKLWKKEVYEKFEADPIMFYSPGVVYKQWYFQNEKDLEKWIVTSDSDNKEGFSSCSFTLSPQGNALFSGTLDTRTPKDGKIKRSGYCSIRSMRALKSFKRDSFFNWTPFTHLILRVRGDGRTYMLNIATSGYFDQLWNDVYHFVLHTRGGPYWQVAKIPFSKFFFSSKGRVQDLQNQIELSRVTHFGITAADKINGDFALEIDYIGLETDPTHDEEFAYEMYRTGPNIAAN